MTEAFVTLATTDEYCCGALVLAESLRRVGTTRQIVCMVTNTVSEIMRASLDKTFDRVVLVDVLDSNDTENLRLLSRPDLGVSFTKLHCWRLTEYTKCVFLDADTLVVKNVDDLFEREELSAAPDPGWADCFNSGVFVFVPNLDTYRALLDLAFSEGSFDGGDQGLLNLYFSDWPTKDIRRHLPITYNCIAQIFYSYPPAVKRFGYQIRIVHFIGTLKPWQHQVNADTGCLTLGDEISAHSLQFLNFWWHIFLTDVKPKINPDVVRVVWLAIWQNSTYLQARSFSHHRRYCLLLIVKAGGSVMRSNTPMPIGFRTSKPLWINKSTSKALAQPPLPQ
uniref:glycogenin glucosyltransferase n=1 Tax=Mesocestoides corti TaxID=53468 RepID=A0A5K3ESG1_MESCO